MNNPSTYPYSIGGIVTFILKGATL